MSLTAEQYLALCALVKTDFPTTSPSDPLHSTVQDLIDDSNAGTLPIKDYKDQNGNINRQFDSLSDLSGYTLISFQPNTDSGFAGAAFQAPDPKNPDGTPVLDAQGNPIKGEVIFAFRGTEPDFKSDPIQALKDFHQGFRELFSKKAYS